MTKEEVVKLADKIALGTATEEEIIEYNRVCEFAELTGSNTVAISEEEQKALDAALRRNIFRETGGAKVYRLNWAKWSAAAASVILIVAVGWNFFFSHKQQPAIVKNNETRIPNFINRHIVNTTGHNETFLLPDSSSVVLSDKSELLYTEPFVNSRDITLVGKGYFKVTKDKTRPFIVTSSVITTTALGTAFTVTAVKNASSITVRLYEGKVVVKAVNKSNPRLQKDIYLLPGQEYIYNNDKDGVFRSFVKNKNASQQIKPEVLQEDNPFIEDDKGSWYMFNNQSLAQVLDQLATLYNVKIIYNKKDVMHIYFTARYNKTDSLETILTRIGKLNKLRIVKNDTAFIISK